MERNITEEINKRLDNMKEDINRVLRLYEFIPFLVGAALGIALLAMIIAVWV